jgi:hypothetical protein
MLTFIWYDEVPGSLWPRGCAKSSGVAFGRNDQGRFLVGYLMSDGRLIPAAIITAVICGFLFYAAFFRLAI